jgi:glycosyltransferase involved in cell wall biosynthesis
VDETAVKLVWHGRIAPHHGPLRFVEIAEQVKGAEARLCGKGPDLEAVTTRLKEIGKPHWWIGFLPNRDLGPFLSEGDCGVYPLENMAGVPCVLLESMAVGLPTLAYATGAVRELIVDGENGFICSGPEEMIRTLRELDRDEALRKRIREKALETIEKHWSLEATLKSLESEFQEILGR